MTLPTIIQKQQDKIAVTRVKKAYSILQQAYLGIREKEGTPDEWNMGDMYDTETHKILANKFIPYIKVITNCVGMSDADVQKNCTTVYYSTRSYASIKIADGTTIIFRNWNASCNYNFGTSKALKEVCGNISIDINSTDKPNVAGNDIFGFYLTREGIFPIGTAQETRLPFESYCTKDKVWGQIYNAFTNGSGCTAWVLYNENRDYLKCNDLSWDGKKKCSK